MIAQRLVQQPTARLIRALAVLLMALPLLSACGYNTIPTALPARQEAAAALRACFRVMEPA